MTPVSVSTENSVLTSKGDVNDSKAAQAAAETEAAAKEAKAAQAAAETEAAAKEAQAAQATAEAAAKEAKAAQTAAAEKAIAGKAALEESLPQTGMSGIHKVFAGLAALMGIAGIGLVKKSRKEDEE